MRATRSNEQRAPFERFLLGCLLMTVHSCVRPASPLTASMRLRCTLTLCTSPPNPFCVPSVSASSYPFFRPDPTSPS